MRFRDRSSVSALRSGETFLVAMDDQGVVRWSGFRDPPVWVHKIATVESCTEVDGSIGEAGDDEGSGQVTGLGSEWCNLFDLKIRVDGEPFKVQVRGNATVTLIAHHHPVCGECGQLWPCVEDRMDDAGRRLQWELEDLCGHCGKSIGGAWSVSFHDGLTRRKFHSAQKYRGPDGRKCRDALAALRASSPAVAPSADATSSDDTKGAS